MDRRALLTLPFMAACWASPPPPAQPLANAMPRERDTRLPRHTEWLGRYLCPQGPTGLRLVIDSPERATATAVFEFFPLEENPGVPRGSFRMTGVVTTDAAGGLTIDLAPEAWIIQPTGYLMVGVSATTDAARETLKGSISNASCTTVEANRSA